MLVAELRGKLSTAGPECECGHEHLAQSAQTSEDVLTSLVFGRIRYLSPANGLGRLFERVGLRVDPLAGWDVELWPETRAMPCLHWGSSEPVEIGCEPDVMISHDDQVLIVEAKYRSMLGSDATQLPREVLYAADRQPSRWRLLCVTTGPGQPRIASCRNEGGRTARGPNLPVAEAVASFFAAFPDLFELDAAAVKERVHWLSWSDVVELLDASGPENQRLIVQDLHRLIDHRGLRVLPFKGFVQEAEPLGLVEARLCPGFHRLPFTGFVEGGRALSPLDYCFLPGFHAIGFSGFVGRLGLDLVVRAPLFPGIANEPRSRRSKRAPARV